MRYAQITPFEVCNGKGAGVSLFVQGCYFHCKGCFNQESWDFCGGKEWTEEVENKFFELIDKPYIKRVTILGGEPLADENVETVFELIKKIKEKFLTKDIWLYTGYTFEQVFPTVVTDDFNLKRFYKQEIVKMCDVMVDGRFIEELKDLTLKFCGSKNQRVINIKESIKHGGIKLWIL